VKNIDLF